MWRCSECDSAFEDDEIKNPVCPHCRNGKTLKKFKYSSIRDYHIGEFNRLHKEGAEKFGMLWLSVNNQVVQSTIGMVDWDCYSVENKHALTKVAFKICQWFVDNNLQKGE